MNANDLQRQFYAHEWSRYELIAPNIYLDWQFNEMDIFALRKSGFIHEIEIKLSRADFLADFKKKVKVKNEDPTVYPWGHARFEYSDRLKHEVLQLGIPHCNYFSFLMPKEIADKCDIPEYAGLYIAESNSDGSIRIREVKSPKRLHKRKISEDLKYQVGRKMAYRYWALVRQNENE